MNAQAVAGKGRLEDKEEKRVERNFLKIARLRRFLGILRIPLVKANKEMVRGKGRRIR